jgi:hypothetical protein
MTNHTLARIKRLAAEGMTKAAVAHALGVGGERVHGALLGQARENRVIAG